jgi:hypothetical protein
MPPAKKTSSAQNTTLQSTGMDVIKQYPGPLTVSRAVKVDVPGKHFPQLTGAEQKASYTGTAVEFTERHTFARYMLKYAKGISAAPSSTSPDPSSSDAAASAAPSSALGLGPPVDLRLTLRRPAP